LEKDNFVNKFAKAKEIVKICIIRVGKKNEKYVKQGKVKIEKKNVNTKKFRKMKIILFSMECSIFLGENLKSHMHFLIPIYPFQKNLATLCIFINLLGQL
jgi:hypothetical protein